MLIASIVFGFSSCTKEVPNGDGQNPFYVPGGGGGGTEPEPTPGLPVGEVPASFTKKVVLEENTGEWCGWCPEGAEIMEDNIAANPGKVVGIAIHDGDPMEVASYNSWQKGLTNVGGFPNGSVDRADASSRGSWTGAITANLAKTAECGIAMVTSEAGGLLNVDVYVGYNAPIASGKMLTVAIVENDVPQSSPGAQSNYSSTVVVDANWMHSHVFRGTITADAGDPIELNSSDKYTKVEFAGVDLSSFNLLDKANAHVAAFVNDNSGARDVLNAQEASFNEVKKWD